MGDVTGNPKYGLLKRVSDENIGYILTDANRASQTKTFNTKLAGNINKYITSRYCPKFLNNGDPSINVWNANYSFSAISQ
ncbi:MAG: hypothetical protein WCK88_03325 [bacterium]